jgi:hypothetical protein
MATVRFSKELKEDIVKNAIVVFKKRMETAYETRPDALAWAEKIYDTLFGQHVATLNAVPQDFLFMTEAIDVVRIGDNRCDLRFNFVKPKPWPRKFPENNEHAKASSYTNVEISLKDHLAWEELSAEVKAWQERRAEVATKRDEFVAQVKKIIEAHATLAPALKMWPPLWDLVPESYKDRHREIKEREKKEVSVNVDLGAMTAAVVANKIGG